MKTNAIALILAAGRGTRFKSDKPKVVHELLGKPLISYVLDTLKGAGIGKAIVVAGFGSERLKKMLPETKIVIQKRLLGSGDAVKAAAPALKGYAGDLVILCGDVPLVRTETIRRLMAEHVRSKACATVLTAKVKDASGYGRIARDRGGDLIKIVEDGQADVFERSINEMNVGLYCFKARDLFEAMGKVKAHNKKKEYFLTDAIEIISKKGKKVSSVEVTDMDEFIGINTRKDMAEAARFLKEETLHRLMESGVTIQDPSTTVIYPDVIIGKDSVIYPHTVIESDVVIGRRCHVGPFSRIRPGVRLDDSAEVGNFVELVRTTLGSHTKVKHHTYLGDARVGKNVNIGAGTITANYDGKNKNITVIEDGAFIGVGAVLIAPVRIGKKALVGAGCVVPKRRDVPNGAIVIGIPARILPRDRRARARAGAVG